MTFVCDKYFREQTFNCGRQPEYIETVGRLAAQHGAFYYISASGSGGGTCNASEYDVPYSSEVWTPAAAGLQDWLPSEQDLQGVKADILAMNKVKSSVGR
jgi:hypothetical protein